MTDLLTACWIVSDGAPRYFASAREREAIRRRRAAGAPPPWTEDEAFAAWRFCNVHREHDKTTVWFREEVRRHLSGVRAVEATAIFRWFNRIEVGERIKDLLLHGWDEGEARQRLRDVEPVTNAAYMVNTPPGLQKLEGVLACVRQVQPHLPALVERWGDSLEAAWRDLKTLPRVGSFVAYEIVTDLRWTPVLQHATDVQTWAAAGPGCAKGLGYVVNNDPSTFRYGSQRDQARMNDVMRQLLAMSRDEEFWPQTWDRWEMREVEMWACEFCKYMNAVTGRRLKRRFPAGPREGESK